MLWISPQMVQRRCFYRKGNPFKGPAALPPVRTDGEIKILDGDWDRYTVPFEEQGIFRSFFGFMTFGVPHISSGYGRRIRRRVQLSRKAKDEVTAKKSLKLINSLRVKGYCPSRAKNQGNIRVAIGREGEILFTDGGTHRLTVSKLLNLDRIGVDVVARHLQWDNFREEVKARGRSYQKLMHPDLESLPYRFGKERAEILFQHLQGGKRALDIGANVGYMSHRLEDLGYDVLAIELKPEVYKILDTVRKSVRKRFATWRGDVRDLENPIDVDVVLALNVFRYMLDDHGKRLSQFLKRLSFRQMFFSSRRQTKLGNTKAFAHWIAQQAGKQSVEFIGHDGFPRRGQPEGRQIYLIS